MTAMVSIITRRGSYGFLFSDNARIWTTNSMERLKDLQPTKKQRSMIKYIDTTTRGININTLAFLSVCQNEHKQCGIFLSEPRFFLFMPIRLSAFIAVLPFSNSKSPDKDGFSKITARSQSQITHIVYVTAL